MTKEHITVEGLRDFQKQLAHVERKWPGAAAKANRTVARDVAAEARSFAHGTGRMQAHFASRIYGTGTPTSASVGVRREANAAFWGAKKHTGWYTKKPGPPQFPEWVGNNWRVGVLGQGPLAINPAVFHQLPEIERQYDRAIESLWNTGSLAIPH